jgi:hypothetical protein
MVISNRAGAETSAQHSRVVLLDMVGLDLS